MQETYTPSPLDTELLLAQNAWVKKLARSLVRDPAGADDVAQETMLAALKAPPHDAQDEGRLRAWLGRVAYNISHLQVRRSVRRRAREERVARHESQASAAESVAHDSTMKLVVDAVHALEEPYRTTVRQRYFHGRSTADIAAFMGTTDNAVRKRLWRARKKLRTILDAEHNGDRMAWFSALAPLAGLRLDAALTSKGSASTTSITSIGWTAGLVSAAAAVVAVATALHDPSDRADALNGTEVAAAFDAPGATDASAELQELRTLAPSARTSLPTTTIVSNEAERPNDAPERFDVETPSDARTTADAEEAIAPVRVQGRVVDLDGRSVAGQAIVDASAPDEVLGYSVFDGGFALEVTPPAQLRAVAEGFAPLRESQVEAWSANGDHLLVVSPAIDVAGHVVDDQDRPLEGVVVRLGLDEVALLDAPNTVASALLATSPIQRTVRTDADGRFSLTRIATGSGLFLEAEGMGLAATRIAVPTASTQSLLFRLERTDLPEHVLAGRVLNDNGQPVDDANVRLGAASTRSDANGSFSLRWHGPVDPNTPLVATKDGFEQVHTPMIGMFGAPEESDSAWANAPSVGLVLAQTAFSLRGRVVDASGAPCEGWFCWASPSPETNDASVPQSLPTAMTDANGEYELRGLAGQEYVVQAFDPTTLIQTAPQPADPSASSAADLAVPAEVGMAAVRGRVVAKNGAPLAGSEVRLALAVAPLDGGHAYGASVLTDAFGWFELGGVPTQSMGLEVRTALGPASLHNVASADFRTALELRAPQWTPLQVELDVTLALAETFAVLDADGRLVPIRGADGSRSHGRLIDGRSLVYATTEDAATLVVFVPGSSEPIRADLEDVAAAADDDVLPSSTTGELRR